MAKESKAARKRKSLATTTPTSTLPPRQLGKTRGPSEEEISAVESFLGKVRFRATALTGYLEDRRRKGLCIDQFRIEKETAYLGALLSPICGEPFPESRHLVAVLMFDDQLRDRLKALFDKAGEVNEVIQRGEYPTEGVLTEYTACATDLSAENTASLFEQWREFDGRIRGGRSGAAGPVSPTAADAEPPKQRPDAPADRLPAPSAGRQKNANKKTRKKIPKKVDAAILINCQRRCCLCFGFDHDDGRKQGQTAHLDHDTGNNDPDNLAFMCHLHHAEYDTRPSQTKGLTIQEAKHYRQKLLCHLKRKHGATAGSARV